MYCRDAAEKQILIRLQQEALSAVGAKSVVGLRIERGPTFFLLLKYSSDLGSFLQPIYRQNAPFFRTGRMRVQHVVRQEYV